MKAWELLSDRSKWTRGAYARTADGEWCSSWSEIAVRWCAVGAINRCYPDQWDRLNAKLKVREKTADNDELSKLNDAGEYDAVLAILKEADV